MGFEDLCDDDHHRPLTEPRLIADMLDLCIPMADRRAGAIGVLMCDEDSRLVQPAIVGDPPPRPSEEDREHLVDVFIEAMGGAGSLLLAIARWDGLSITPDDMAWRRTAHRVCAESSAVRLLGVHVVTRTGSREVHEVAV